MFNSVCNELKIPLRSAHLVWVYKWHIIDLFFFFFKRTSCSTFPTSHLFTSSSLSLQGMPQRVDLSYRVFLETVLSVLWPLWKPDHTVYNRQMNDKKNTAFFSFNQIFSSALLWCWISFWSNVQQAYKLLSKCVSHESYVYVILKCFESVYWSKIVPLELFVPFLIRSCCYSTTLLCRSILKWKAIAARV